MFRKTFGSRFRCIYDNIHFLENMLFEDGSNVQDFGISVEEWNLWAETLLVEICRNSAPS